MAKQTFPNQLVNTNLDPLDGLTGPWETLDELDLWLKNTRKISAGLAALKKYHTFFVGKNGVYTEYEGNETNSPTVKKFGIDDRSIEAVKIKLGAIGTDELADEAVTEAKLSLELAEIINGKVDSETGKGLSSNDYSNEDKSKLNTLPTSNEINTSLGLKADKQSPTFSGIPTAPTAAAGNNTTQIATTEFVTGAVTTETTARTNAISAESTARISKDTSLETQLNTLIEKEANDIAALNGMTINPSGTTADVMDVVSTSMRADHELDKVSTRGAMVDFVMTQDELIKSDIAQINTKITEFDEDINGKSSSEETREEVNLTNFIRTSARIVIDTGCWENGSTSSSSCYLVPVGDADKVEIKSKESYSTQWAPLQNNIVNGGAYPSYCSGYTWGGNTVGSDTYIPANTTKIVDFSYYPNCKYLYFRRGGSSADYSPLSVTLITSSGEEVKGIKVDLAELESRVTVLEESTETGNGIFDFNPNSEYLPKLNSLSRAGAVVFSHVSDVHGHSENYSRFLEWSRYWKTQGKITEIVDTGDILYSNWASPFIWDADSLNVNDVLFTVGNHDTYGTTTGLQHWTDHAGQDAYDRFFSTRISNWNVQYQENKCYYYKDYGSLRAIYLDVMKFDSDESTWLSETLTSAKTANKHVLIFCHYIGGTRNFITTNYSHWSGQDSKDPSSGWPNQYSTATGMLSIVQEFIDNGGVFCGYVCGHSHVDCVFYPNDYKKQWVFQIGSDNPSESTDFKNCTDRGKDNFQVIGIDTTRKTITFIKVGGKIGLMGISKDILVVRYGQKSGDYFKCASNNQDVYINKCGETSKRPSTTLISSGFNYYDITLSKPIWWNGTAWVDSNGTIV